MFMVVVVCVNICSWVVMLKFTSRGGGPEYLELPFIISVGSLSGTFILLLGV
jgi:hypothetical protein